jgi:hypothetical protein
MRLTEGGIRCKPHGVMQVEAGKRTKVQLEEVKRRFAAREEANAALAASLQAERDEALTDLRDAAEQRTVLGQQVTALESSLQTEQQLVEALHQYLGSLESELEVCLLTPPQSSYSVSSARQPLALPPDAWSCGVRAGCVCVCVCSELSE